MARRFDDAVLKDIAKCRQMGSEPGQDVFGEISLVGASLHDLKRQLNTRPLEQGQPFTELEGEEFTEERPDTHAGKVVTALPKGVFFLFIISINGTIQGVFHEAGKGDRALNLDFCADLFSEFV